MKRYDYIDAIRGLAILGVLFVHTQLGLSEPLPVWLSSIVGQGARGVQLFYLVSALTLFLSLDFRSSSSSSLTTGKKQESNLNFFIRRFFRIAPLYYLALVVYLLVDGTGPRYWLGSQPEITWLNIISAFTFTNGWNPYWINSIFPVSWSIPIEVTFYIFVPFLFNKINSFKKSILFLIFCYLLSIILKNILQSFNLPNDERLFIEFRYLWFPNQLPVFALGVVTFFLLKLDLKSLTPKKLTDKQFGLSLLFISSLLFLLANLNPPIPTILFPKLYIFSASFVLLVLSLKYFPIFLLVNSFTKFMGKISFGIYLTHILTIRVASFFVKGIPNLNNSILEYTLIFIISLILTCTISYILHVTIELRMIEFGKTFIERRRKSN